MNRYMFFKIIYKLNELTTVRDNEEVTFDVVEKGPPNFPTAEP